jgi:hypothetical protein
MKSKMNPSAAAPEPNRWHFGKSKVRQEAGAISRWKSGPGKAQQAAWKRVLRAPTPAAKRTQLLHGVCD